ncbi:MAG TPA: hypothetical protein VGU61_11465 [Noviherbaspirillum sp.]|jgi:hypothetical protein|uniref:hypothetical protein n=1 Tax=Noviherbaspirillum sp. TaxID=1926288 RepID=UPI002DDD3BAE|nr:hypothetical protein [Noviherbaspirillum sp.]HEV2610877.1 hypothetical protein [Noviherbaspirillum sp.]
MPTVRLSPKEVRVDDAIYVFDVVQIADAFEACVAITDATHCESDYAPIAKRAAEESGRAQIESS